MFSITGFQYNQRRLSPVWSISSVEHIQGRAQSPCCRVFLVCGNTLQLVITMAAMRWEPSFHAHILLQEIIHSYTKEMLCKECFFIRPVTALLHKGVVRCSELVGNHVTNITDKCHKNALAPNTSKNANALVDPKMPKFFLPQCYLWLEQYWTRTLPN